MITTKVSFAKSDLKFVKVKEGDLHHLTYKHVVNKGREVVLIEKCGEYLKIYYK